ncbi:zeta toxin family protein [Streptomyces virginiae]|uniref:zeta toxin family protein n=1 Tax=Streptomyces virginiae TaxID=1961 RepID=UPI0036F7C2CF
MPDNRLVYLSASRAHGNWRRAGCCAGQYGSRTVVVDPDVVLRGHHPDHFQLVNDTPRTADELVRADAEDWQAEAEAYVRERRSDLPSGPSGPAPPTSP